MKNHNPLIRKILSVAGFGLFLLIFLLMGKEISALAVDFWNGLCDAIWEIGAVIEQLPI